jgi:hypothetical protein
MVSHLVGNEREVSFLYCDDQHAGVGWQPAVTEGFTKGLTLFHIECLEPAVAGIAESVDIEAGRSRSAGKVNGRTTT